jgi:hypothetical protein
VGSPKPHTALDGQPNGRKIIDDTDTFDPGRDPADMFAEAERNAKVVNDRSQRLGFFNGRFVNLAPWLAILVLSLLGFSIGLVDAIQQTGVAPGASTILAVFGMLVVMSAYFILTRATEKDS